MEFHKSTAVVTDRDKQFLKKRAILSKIFPIVLAELIGIIVFFFLVMMDKLLIGVLVIGLVFVISAVMILSSLQFASFMSQKKKTILKGLITDRYQKLGGPSGMFNAGSNSVRHATYNYFAFGDYHVRVNNAFYRHYKIGDAVELHFIESQEHSAVPLPLHHARLTN